jgi:transcriptional regulator with XRE-family HTH domain
VTRPENPIEYASTDELYRGSRIRELRQKKGLSREKMAALLSCHPDSLSNVETNSVDPSQRMLAKIAKLLKVPLEHLEHAPVHPRIQRKKDAIKRGDSPQVLQRDGRFPLPIHSTVGQLTHKASAPSTRLNTPLPISHKEMLMKRLGELEKVLHNAHEEVLKIGALIARMQD